MVKTKVVFDASAEEKKPEDTKEPDALKLRELADRSNQKLLKVSGVFPFDLFPDDFIIDKDKISVINRSLLQSEYVKSFSLADVQDVYIETVPFFGTLKVNVRGYKDNPLTVRFLKKKDAVRSRRILQGVIEALKAGVNLSKVGSEELLKKTEEIGTVLPS